MIQSGRASLVVVASETDPAVISEMLALTPTRVEYKGTVARSGRVRENHVWSLDVDSLDNTRDDETGTRALRALLMRSGAAFGRVTDLPTDCDARIWWSLDSDSTQGGFILPADLADSISALGVDIYATVYLDEGEE